MSTRGQDGEKSANLLKPINVLKRIEQLPGAPLKPEGAAPRIPTPLCKGPRGIEVIGAFTPGVCAWRPPIPGCCQPSCAPGACPPKLPACQPPATAHTTSVHYCPQETSLILHTLISYVLWYIFVAVSKGPQYCKQKATLHSIEQSRNTEEVMQGKREIRCPT